MRTKRCAVCGCKVDRDVGWHPDPSIVFCSYACRDAHFDDAKRLYFIQCGDDGPIKIGCTVAIESRVASLQGAHWQELRLLGHVAGTHKDERALHSRYSNERIRGEWFLPSKRLVAEVAVILAWGDEWASLLGMVRDDPIRHIEELKEAERLRASRARGKPKKRPRDVA